MEYPGSIQAGPEGTKKLSKSAVKTLISPVDIKGPTITSCKKRKNPDVIKMAV